MSEYIVELDSKHSISATPISKSKIPISIDEYATIERDGKAVTITMEQWCNFCSEISQYTDMRLDSMFERGCW